MSLTEDQGAKNKTESPSVTEKLSDYVVYEEARMDELHTPLNRRQVDEVVQLEDVVENAPRY